MKPRTKSLPDAASSAAARIDDASFRAEIGALKGDPDIVAFATHFGLPWGVVRGWRDGLFVPRPELRLSYVTWVRAYVTAQRVVRQRVDAQLAARPAAGVAAAKVAAKAASAKVEALSKLTPAQRAALVRSRSQTG